MEIMKIFLKKSAYKRLKIIRKKQEARRIRIAEAFKTLREWDDIPLSWQWTSIARTLEIVPDKAAKNLIYRMCLDLHEQDLEKLIPLES